MPKTKPSFRWENDIRQTGFERIAGLDEVGRGCLAGPLVAAAVVLPDNPQDSLLELINDSKALTPRQRERAFDAIVSAAESLGVGSCDSEEVDRMGIAAATRSAMRRALADSGTVHDFVIVDAVRDLGIATPYISIIKGDSQSYNVAAASIVAKVSRDRMMAGQSDTDYPEYGFAQHKGYGTARHLHALREHGPTPIHRMSFRPVAQVIADREWSAIGTHHGRVQDSAFRYSLPPGTGRTGELAAARRLTELGYDILQRNHRTAEGEIDIVAVEDDQTVFVEVKTRRRSDANLDDQMGCAPVESFTPRKVERVMNCAESYMSTSSYRAEGWRVDFVGVELGSNGQPLEIKVIKNIETY